MSDINALQPYDKVRIRPDRQQRYNVPPNEHGWIEYTFIWHAHNRARVHFGRRTTTVRTDDLERITREPAP